MTNERNTIVKKYSYFRVNKKKTSETKTKDFVANIWYLIFASLHTYSSDSILKFLISKGKICQNITTKNLKNLDHIYLYY